MTVLRLLLTKVTEYELECDRNFYIKNCFQNIRIQKEIK